MNDHFPETNDAAIRAARRSRVRRRVGLAALVVVVIALLALVPPLLSLKRYQHRIAASMSQSLNRDVHMDGVELHLLPMPMLVLSNLVVDEDPAFGAEPTIRANSVEARVRISSLWRRHVEFSRIKFVDPSLNLVRNSDGRWNLDSVLVHASKIDAAPTAQRTAGSLPRFPYIEATGARVNIKLGDEKMPFSLNDAEFALWLPSAQQWQVRIDGKPMRTDVNVADSGTMHLEGSLERASKLELVPVNLRASWHDSPLGEASRLLHGADAGWRGTLHTDATVTGLLGQAAVSANITLNNLRRADFVPRQPLDVTASCTATLNVALAQLGNARCQMPQEGADPVVAQSPAIVLQHPADAEITFDAHAIPLQRAFAWLKVLSPRIPPLAEPDGAVSFALARDAQHTWSGTATLTLPAAETKTPPANQQPQTFAWTVESAATIDGCRQALVLAPTAVKLPQDGPLSMNAAVSFCGYTLGASGVANETDLTSVTRDLPQLMDGVSTALPDSPTAAHFDVSCTRGWGADPVCTAARPEQPVKKPTRRKR